MPEGSESEEAAQMFARKLERDRDQSERAVKDFRASLPVHSPSADPVEDFAGLHEHWFTQLYNVNETARTLSVKYECDVRSADLQDSLKTHFLRESQEIVARIYTRAGEQGLLDRWITNIEGLQALILDYDRLQRIDLRGLEPVPYNHVINSLIYFKKHVPDELARIRRLSATIKSKPEPPAARSGLQRRLLEALEGRIVPSAELAERLRMKLPKLRSFITRINKQRRIIFNKRDEGYFRADRLPPGRDDLGQR